MRSLIRPLTLAALAPMAASAHLRQRAAGQVRDHPSHTPAGALMAHAFRGTPDVATAAGRVMTGGATPMQGALGTAAVASGDRSALIRDADEDDESALSEAAEEVHDVAANLLLILAALSLAEVFVENRAMRRNPVVPMLSGERRK